MRFLKGRPGRRRLWRLGAVLLLAAVAAAVYHTAETEWAARHIRTAMDRALALSARAGFGVRDVMVIGRERTSREEVRSAVGAVAGSPILAVDIRAARMRVEALPWVQEAEVERALPDILIVRLIERETLAVWDRGNGFAVVDERGKPIAAADPRVYADLPVIRGDGAAGAAPAMLAMLRKERNIARRITGLSYVSGRRWNVHLDWRIEIKLPEEGAEAAWARLAQIDRERQLLDGDIAHIDMRFDGRMVLRMAGNATAERS